MADARSRPRRLRPVLIATAALAAVVAVAWVMQAAVSDGGAEPPQGGSALTYTIAVEQGGEVLKTYDLAALRALPQTRIVIDGKEQTGPSLSVVLVDAGVGAFDTVDIRGAGLRDKGFLQLTARQVRQRVQIDFNDRGTVKVCGPELYRAEWVRDVLTIDAR